MVNITDGLLYLIDRVANAPRTDNPPDKPKYYLGDIWVKPNGQMFVWDGNFWKSTGVKLP